MKNLFSVILLLISYSATADDPSLPLFRSREWQERTQADPEYLYNDPGQGRLALEMEAQSFFPFAIRVGSPLFNVIRNELRNLQDEGDALSEIQQALLQVENIEGVGPNTLLVFGEELHDGNYRPVFFEGYLDTGALTGWQLYLYDQAKGWAEIVIENGLIYALGLPTQYTIKQPLEEIVNAVSSRSVWERFANSGFAIWDASSGTVYAAIDIFSQMSEGDIARAVKAGIRVPLTALQLGGTLAVKTFRLPLDLVMSGLNALGGLFNSNSTPSEDLWNLITENNSYDLEFTVNNTPLSGQVHFGLERGQTSIAIEGENAFLSWVVGITSDLTPEFRELLPESENYFIGEIQYREKRFLLVGSVAGLFDIDIEGSVYEFPERSSLRETLEKTPQGRFHFDDV